MPNNPDLLTRLSAVMRKVGWETTVVDGYLRTYGHQKDGVFIYFYDGRNDMENARAIILMLEEIEKRGGVSYGWTETIDREKNLAYEFSVSGHRGDVGWYPLTKTTGKTRAECVAEAFIQVVGE